MFAIHTALLPDKSPMNRDRQDSKLERGDGTYRPTIGILLLWSKRETFSDLAANRWRLDI